jgi:hyperosmotically inducible protein
MCIRALAWGSLMTSRMKTLLVRALRSSALVALLALACSASRAQGSAVFDGYDANHDGSVTLDEWRRVGGDPLVFQGSDADGDGRLDRDEIVKARSWDERVKAAEYAGDAWVTAKVKAVLLMDQAVSGAGVKVVTHDGNVQLSGFVASDEESRHAARLASQVEGVRTVVNSLTVKRAVAAGGS